MTTKDQIKVLFVDDTMARRKAIRDFIMDKTQPYEDRLEVWRQTPLHLRHHDNWVAHLTDYERKYGEISWYDDFGVERHGEVHLDEAEQHNLLYDADEERKRVFYENCLDLGIHSFTYDW